MLSQKLTTLFIVVMVSILQKRIEQGIITLAGIIDGKPKNQPFSGDGPYANCGRVSCSYGAAIYWCNMNNYELELDSYKQIADAAKQVVELCSVDDKVAGSVLMEGNWRVVVANAGC
ncbi:hypothetical protein SMACR_03760 [Sordaria macrospora]|uniref:WGS project CABT00000000 data, contig 2.16 n=2 Tax=Sordaria macrospora TaxID=5147 RepID=F7VZV4_SORMK|nr:uncharacterized protein SMAC_03760 [Sordaria macrospora k-hell]KAA8629454.1 hypothetical protein SMACR_03760 [Sordaria macrospora]KAH7631316.1 hypothetical protein B0T09DRAFT_320965 [Sordaria sp. MPI-SDFR-AT-0083]WPJ61601.1 hypothetical protein SMAC4_03760 [Sordaria macrospora]CCC11053.1 unnamed protein product [Sordaria macrospora k-hell]